MTLVIGKTAILFVHNNIFFEPTDIIGNTLSAPRLTVGMVLFVPLSVVGFGDGRVIAA
jgi:hypothetical protein